VWRGNGGLIVPGRCHEAVSVEAKNQWSLHTAASASLARLPYRSPSCRYLHFFIFFPSITNQSLLFPSSYMTPMLAKPDWLALDAHIVAALVILAVTIFICVIAQRSHVSICLFPSTPFRITYKRLLVHFFLQAHTPRSNVD
jgi:hypothetical protein